MFFSVIIPVYNVEKYLRKCMESVAAQEFSDYEVILVDDGSEDSSGSLCDLYSQKYSNVKTIHQKNSGLAAARNTGMAAASGEWLVFVDSDDWIERGMLDRLFKKMQQQKADMYCFNVYKTDEQGSITEKLIFSPEDYRVALYNEESRFHYFVDILMQYKAGWEAWDRIYNRELIRKYSLEFMPCEEVFAEDFLFTFQYLLHAEGVVQLCGIFYYYRQRKASIIHSVEEHTVIPRLYAFAEMGYQSVKTAQMPLFRREYYLLYFMLLNFHLQYMLSQVPDDEIQSEMEKLKAHRNHRIWLRQMRKNRKELEKYMRVKKWL